MIGTCFALLFLSKGRWPVLLDKLEHRPADDWNLHRSDVANLTRYVERSWKRDLTWQVSDLRLATRRGSAAIAGALFVRQPRPGAGRTGRAARSLRKSSATISTAAGSSLPRRTAAATGAEFDARLPRADQAGLSRARIQAAAAGTGTSDLARRRGRSTRARCGRCWGSSSAAARAWSMFRPIRRDDPRPSLSCLWELSRPGRGEKYSRPVQSQIDAALSLGINVLAYATNRELKPKEDLLQADGRRGRETRSIAAGCTSPRFAIPAAATPRRGPSRT